MTLKMEYHAEGMNGAEMNTKKVEGNGEHVTVVLLGNTPHTLQAWGKGGTRRTLASGKQAHVERIRVQNDCLGE